MRRGETATERAVWNRVAKLALALAIIVIGWCPPARANDDPTWDCSLSTDGRVMAVPGSQGRTFLNVTASVFKTDDTHAPIAGAGISFTTSVGAVRIGTGVTDPGGGFVTQIDRGAAPAAGQVQLTAIVNGKAKTKVCDLAQIGGQLAALSPASLWFFDSAGGTWSEIGAAPGQPEATAYSWAITSGADKAAVVQGAAESRARVEGRGASVPPGNDVTATLTYSWQGEAVTSSVDFSVRRPSSLPRNAARDRAPDLYYLNDPVGNTMFYGFDGQIRAYTLLDQFGATCPSISWSEVWQNPRPIGEPGPNAVGLSSDIYGVVIDNLACTGRTPPAGTPPPTRPNGWTLVMLDQSIYAGSYTNWVGVHLLDNPNVTYTTVGALFGAP